MRETPECSYKKENLICIRCIDFLPDDAGSNFVVEVFFFFFLKIHPTSSLRVNDVVSQFYSLFLLGAFIPF